MIVSNWGTPEALPDEHRLFTTGDASRVAIADNSGRTPDDTDDGVLWLDFERFLIADGTHLAIPLVDDAGKTSRTGTDLATMLLLATRYGWTIDTGDAKYGVCKFERIMLEADYQGERWHVHGYEWDRGVENREVVVLKKSPKDRRRRTYNWTHAAVAELENIEWAEVSPRVRPLS
jgi:hypothetical protein